MPKVYTVAQGDHLSGVALQNGFRSYKTIWSDGANADLAAKRDPHVLVPGDQVTIPDRQRRTTTRSTDNTHNFRVLAQKLFLKLRLLDVNGAALKGADCAVGVDAKSGTTDLTADGDGKIQEEIPRASKTGEVTAGAPSNAAPAAQPAGSGADGADDGSGGDASGGDGSQDSPAGGDASGDGAGGSGAGQGADAVGDGAPPLEPIPADAPDPIKYDLRIGHLNPIFKMSGQQARLNNMGYFAGYTLKDLDQLLWAAEEFQCEATKAQVTARPAIAPAPDSEDDGKADPDAETGVTDGKLRDLLLKTHGV